MLSPPFRRLFSSGVTSKTPLLSVNNAHIYKFGSVKPVFDSPLTWKVASQGEAWAILGDGKQVLFDVRIISKK